MTDTSAQPKEKSDDGFKTIHLPFYSDRYDELKIRGKEKVNGDDKKNYYKLCNVYELGGYLYSNNRKSEFSGAKYISNAIISESDITLLESKDTTLHSCIKHVSDIPCDSNRGDVQEYIEKKLEEKDSHEKDPYLINKCMGNDTIQSGMGNDTIQSGGTTNEKEEPKPSYQPEFYESLTNDKIQKCTLDKTPDESDWWNNEEKYVQINSNIHHINANESSISISDNDTNQDVYMTWTDYTKLIFDTINLPTDATVSTSGIEQDFSFVPETIYIRLKDEEGENGTKYSEYNHKLKLIKYDGNYVILKADNESNTKTLSFDKFKRLFHSAGGGGVVERQENTDADSKDNMKGQPETKPETKPEEKQETKPEEEQQQLTQDEEQPLKEYTIITLKNK